MPSVYTGIAANNPTSITKPSDGDGPGIKAADVNTPLEGLADMLAYLRRDVRSFRFNVDSHLPQSTGVAGFNTTLSPNLALESYLNVPPADPLFYAPSPVSVAFQYQNAFPTSGGWIVSMHLDSRHLVQGNNLVSVSLKFSPDPLGSGLPSNMPYIALVRGDGTYLGDQSLRSSPLSGWVIDTSPNAGVYRAAGGHNITLTVDQNALVDLNTYYYRLLVLMPWGTNADALNYLGKVTVTSARP